MRGVALLGAMVAVVPGCGADTVVATPSSGSGGATSSTTAGTGGDGGGFAVSSSSSGGGGGFEGCAITPDDPFFFGVNGDGPAQELNRGCGWPWPTAQLVQGGRCSPGIQIVGCDPSDGTTIVVLATDLDARGTTMAGRIDYYPTDQPPQYFGSTATVAIDTWFEVGNGITGSYSGTVADIGDPAATLQLDGTFSACRMPDLPPCP
jgi:hypothetical protein